MQEIYKDVVGFEEYFQVSNLGNIYSKRTCTTLRQTTTKTGYKVLSTRIGGRNGKTFCLKVHRLVAEAFLEPPEDYLLDEAASTFYKVVIVNHIDGDKLNNKVSNLEWCTYKENTQHAISTGLMRDSGSYTKLPCGTAAAYGRGCRCSICKDAYKIVRREKYLRTGT